MNWALLFGMSLITFWNRFAFFSENVKLPPGVRLKRFLSYSSYAILTAIWTPILFNYDQASGFDNAGPDYLISASVAAGLSFLKLPSIVVVLISTGLFFLLRVVL
ncbi:MAG: branched-subunit amino acid transport protein [Saprospiraceae bacterium]|jgi:branched-subunit amino acid transport protein